AHGGRRRGDHADRRDPVRLGADGQADGGPPAAPAGGGQPDPGRGAGRPVRPARHRSVVTVIPGDTPAPPGLTGVLTVVLVDDHVTSAVDALRAGADGFLLKSSEPDELVPPLIALASGVSVVPAPVMNALLDAKASSGETRLAGLGEEDIALLRLVAAGLESIEIAEQLHVSERTAKRLVAALLRRIEVANRVQAAAFAGRAGLLESGTSGPPSPP